MTCMVTVAQGGEPHPRWSALWPWGGPWKRGSWKNGIGEGIKGRMTCLLFWEPKSELRMSVRLWLGRLTLGMVLQRAQALSLGSVNVWPYQSHTLQTQSRSVLQCTLPKCTLLACATKPPCLHRKWKPPSLRLMLLTVLGKLVQKQTDLGVRLIKQGISVYTL